MIRITVCVVLCLLSAGCLEATKGKVSKKEPQPTEFKSSTLIVESVDARYLNHPDYRLELSGVIRNNTQYTLTNVQLTTEIFQGAYDESTDVDELVVMSREKIVPGTLKPNASVSFNIKIRFHDYDHSLVGKLIPQSNLGDGEIFVKEIIW